MKNLLLLLLAMTLSVGCAHKGGTAGGSRAFANDTDFAKDAMTRLVNGDHSVEDMLDWEHLSVANQQTSTSYNSIPTEDGKTAFRSAFVTSFSQSFKATGASIDKVEKWEETGKEGNNTKILGTLPNGHSLLITVSHPNGRPKLATIETR